MEHPVESARPRFSVLVPVLNEKRWIVESLAAMRAQDVDGGLEIIVADGGSTDGTREVLRAIAAEDPRVRVFANPRRISPSGMNVCLREARGEYVVSMDAHAIYPTDYVSRGVDRLELGDTSWVSGLAIPVSVGGTSGAVALALSSRLGQGWSRKWTALDTDEVELDTGVFAGVWRREALLELGGWDERWPQNYDGELAARFIARGVRLVCLRAMGAFYVPRDTIPGLWKQYLRYGYYRAQTAWRHPRSMRRSNGLPPALVAAMLSSLFAPRRLRRVSRFAVAGYGVALLLQTAALWRRAESDHEAATVPLVLAVMHVAHGLGMWGAFARVGFPWAALARFVGLGALEARLAPAPRPVCAPSLSDVAISL